MNEQDKLPEDVYDEILGYTKLEFLDWFYLQVNNSFLRGWDNGWDKHRQLTEATNNQIIQATQKIISNINKVDCP
jgi:hypothetical protein